MLNVRNNIWFLGLALLVASCGQQKQAERTLWRVIKQYGDSSIYFNNSISAPQQGKRYKLIDIKQTKLIPFAPDTTPQLSTINRAYSRFKLHVGDISLYTEINQLSGRTVFIGYREGDSEAHFRYDTTGKLMTYQYFESTPYAVLWETIAHKVSDTKAYSFAYNGYGGNDRGGNEKDKQNLKELAMALSDVANKLNQVYGNNCPPVELEIAYNEQGLKQALDSVIKRSVVADKKDLNYQIHLEVSPPNAPVIYCRNNEGLPINTKDERLIREQVFRYVSFNKPTFHCLYVSAKTILKVDVKYGKVQAIHP